MNLSSSAVSFSFSHCAIWFLILPQVTEHVPAKQLEPFGIGNARVLLQRLIQPFKRLAVSSIFESALRRLLAARYASALAGWNGEVTEEFRRKLRTLRGLCQDIVELRRGDHSGARLQMERERLERERAKTEVVVVEQFERWAKNQQVRDWICQEWVSPAERKRRLREIFGLPPELT